MTLGGIGYSAGKSSGHRNVRGPPSIIGPRWEATQCSSAVGGAARNLTLGNERFHYSPLPGIGKQKLRSEPEARLDGGSLETSCRGMSPVHI